MQLHKRLLLILKRRCSTALPGNAVFARASSMTNVNLTNPN
jgi:hypothetical protein